MRPTLLNGFIAGVIATAPMTVAMVAMHRRLPWWQRYPLPPRLLTWRLAHQARWYTPFIEPHGTAVTLVNHFGYGGAAGAVYAATAGRMRGPGVVKGMGWGLVVWAGSYLGLLPGLGLYPSATKAPVKRNALMIAAHLVWGGVLGAVLGRSQVRKPTTSVSLPHDAKHRRALVEREAGEVPLSVSTPAELSKD